MPYIITTNGNEPVAVATLEEARDVAYEALPDITGDLGAYADANRAVLSEIAAIPEQGGTVGPLLDGTVIDVRLLNWYEVARLAGMPDLPLFPNYGHAQDDAARQAEIVAAYNAR